MGTNVFVTLFYNDGLLETRTAKPFRIDRDWSTSFLVQGCYQCLYNRECPQPRLFNQSGAEIFTARLIQYGESLIVSGGEDFLPINYLTKVPLSMQNSTQLASMLEVLNQQPANTNPKSFQPEESQYSMHNVLQEAVGSLLAPTADISSQLTHMVKDYSQLKTRKSSASSIERMPTDSPQLESLFANMLLPSVAIQGTGTGRSSTCIDQGLPMRGIPPPAAANPPPISGTPLSPFIQSPNMQAPQSLPSPNQMDTSGPWEDHTAMSSFSGMPSPGSVELTSPGSGVQWATEQGLSTVPDRVSSHKASEQRSRAKLKGCLSELCLSVPALQQVRNPTKATVLKKAAEYVQETNTRLEAAQQAAKALAEDKEALLMEQRHLEQKLRVSNISTLELTDASHRFIFVDPTWEIVLGYSRQEVVGQLVQDMVDCPTCPFMRYSGKQMKTDLANGKEWAGITVGVRRNGRAFVCETAITPVVGEQGKVIQYVTRRKNFHLLKNSEQGLMCNLQLTQGNNAPNKESLQQLIPEMLSV